MGIKLRPKATKAGKAGALFERALRHHQAGDLAAAEALYQDILALDRRHDGALHYLGILACQVGRWEIAEALIGEAVALRPDHAEARNNLGTALWQQGKAAAAAAEFAAALRLKPEYAEAHNNLANALKDLGRLDEAVERYRRALTLKPAYAEARNNLGSALQSLGRLEEAVGHYEQALGLRPDYPEAHNNFGNALMRLGRLGEAVGHYRRALALKPEYAEARNNLGGALVHLGRLAEAEACFKQALAAKPDFPGALNNLGGALQQQGRMEEAAARFERALALKPDYEEAHRNLIYGLLYRPGVGLPEILAAARRWSATHADPLAPASVPAVLVAAERPPRLGFVSGDFREHVVGRLALPALEALRRAGHDFVCYSNHPLEDALTARFKAAAGAWRPIHGLGDAAAAGLIRADGIEILVDLSGYTADSRLLLFALKPAPVQVTWLGYPATTGLATMDYLLADPVQVPPEADAHYQEKIIRLPGSYLLYRPIPDAPEVGPPPAGRDGSITFGSFNGVQKLAPPVIETWSRILHRLPASRLMLKAPGFTEEAVRRRYRELFAGHGIGEERLEFAGRTTPADHMAAMTAVDIALDSFPYTGGATTVDTLWMGVPVIALIGDTLAHRHSAGYLTATGLADLVAADPDRYVELAVELAADRPRLAELRAGLRARMSASPLCDEAGFVRAFTAACVEIRARLLAGEPPRSLDLTP